MSVWFITGASRGFGAEIVSAALAAGHDVVATARATQSIEERHPDARNHLLVTQLDITDQSSVAVAVAAALERFGRLDVVVNNAGRGVLGAVEEISDVAARAVFDTNVFGTLNVIRGVLPTLRRQKGGQIVNISSVGGFVGSAGWGIYNSTKFAVEGFSEALSKELAPLGITVTLIEPGYFRTDFLDASSLHTEAAVVEDYDGTVGAMRTRAVAVNHAQPGDPVKAAAAILQIASEGQSPLRVQLGQDSFDAVQGKLDQGQRDQLRWHELSVSTDH